MAATTRPVCPSEMFIDGFSQLRRSGEMDVAVGKVDRSATEPAVLQCCKFCGGKNLVGNIIIHSYSVFPPPKPN